ncbi:MAG TPA: hypothetical protein DCR93_26595 [Cytophagales bacterium]|nr:hypothetical protein [Cytophagales bacterium]
MKALQKVIFASILFVLLLFSNGQYAMSFAIWVAVPMLLFAVRKLKRWQGFLFALVMIGASYYFAFDVVPFIPVPVSIALAVMYSAVASLPYLIDSFFSKNRASFLATLVFPTAAVLFEYAYHQFYPYGSWGHLAYSQESQTALLQSISVLGMGYITFLITWFAAVVNWVYEQRQQQGTVKQGVLAYSLVLGITLMYGSYRITFQEANSETVQVASISAQDSLMVQIDLPGLNNPETEQEVKAIIRANTTRLNNHLFDRSMAEAQAGAKIVFWAEGNGTILKEDEHELYNQASMIAAEQKIYLGLGVAVIDPTNSRFLENKFVVFDPEGNKAIDYWKGISVPGAEAPISNNQAVGIQQIDTDYGTLAAVICFDLDFPDYLKGANGTDILLAPSNDFIEIDPMHTDMAKFRAIEQGFNLIRQASHGRSAGTDYTGKVVSEMDHFTDPEKTMVTK